MTINIPSTFSVCSLAHVSRKCSKHHHSHVTMHDFINWQWFPGGVQNMSTKWYWINYSIQQKVNEMKLIIKFIHEPKMQGSIHRANRMWEGAISDPYILSSGTHTYYMRMATCIAYRARWRVCAGNLPNEIRSITSNDDLETHGRTLHSRFDVIIHIFVVQMVEDSANMERAASGKEQKIMKSVVESVSKRLTKLAALAATKHRRARNKNV